MTVDDRDVVSTWIVLDTAETSSYYPQAGRTPSSDASIHRIYWNCVVTFYAVAQRTLGTRYAYVLFTNAENLESSAGPAIADMLRSLDVEIVCIPRVHVTPPNYHSGWANQFYIIDILKHLAPGPPDRAYLVLDSDCIIAHSLDPLFQAAREHGFLTYDTGVPPDKPINGITRTQMGVIFSELGKVAVPSPPPYYGGEFFAATGAAVQQMLPWVDLAWSQSLKRAETGQPKFNEEAHLLAFVYYMLGAVPATANVFVKRLWTGVMYRNGVKGDENLPVWHLPGEKRFGYRKLTPAVLDRQSWFWKQPADAAWQKRIAGLLGVPRPSLLKMAGEVIFYGLNRLRKIGGR